MHFTFPVQVFSTVCTRANGTMPIIPLFSYTQQKMHRRFTAHIYIDDVVFHCDPPHDIALSRDSLSSLSFDSATSITPTSESLPHTLFSGWNTSCQPYAGNMEVEDDWPDAPAFSYGSSPPRYDFNGEKAYDGHHLTNDMVHTDVPSRTVVHTEGEDNWLGAPVLSHGSSPLQHRLNGHAAHNSTHYVVSVQTEVEDDWSDAPAFSYGSSSPRYDFNGEMAYNEAGALAPGHTLRQPNGEMAYNEAGALAPGYTQHHSFSGISHRFQADTLFPPASLSVGTPWMAGCAPPGIIAIPRSPRVNSDVSVHILLTHNLDHVGLGYVNHTSGTITITEFCKPSVYTNEFAVASDVDMLDSLPIVRDPFNRTWTLSPVMAWHTTAQALHHKERLTWAATCGGAVDCKHYVAGAFSDLQSSFITSFYSSDPARGMAVYRSLRCDVAPSPDSYAPPCAPSGCAQVPDHPPLYIDGMNGAKYIVHPQVMAVWTAHANQLHYMVQTQQSFSMNLCHKYNDLLCNYQITCAELERMRHATGVNSSEHHAQTLADQAKRILALESELKECERAVVSSRTNEAQISALNCTVASQAKQIQKLEKQKATSDRTSDIFKARANENAEALETLHHLRLREKRLESVTRQSLELYHTSQAAYSNAGSVQAAAGKGTRDG